MGVIPEPSTWAMIMLGFAGLGLMGYRTKRASGAATAGSRPVRTAA
jgi:PEP-CTERM motif